LDRRPHPQRELRVPRLAGLFPDNQFSNALAHPLPVQEHRVRHCVPASAAPCTPRVRPQRARVRWESARVCRLPVQYVPAAVPERPRAGQASATCPVA
jgi:hypothetical protein